jgi:hypothetical protein
VICTISETPVFRISEKLHFDKEVNIRIIKMVLPVSRRGRFLAPKAGDEKGTGAATASKQPTPAYKIKSARIRKSTRAGHSILHRAAPQKTVPLR